MIHKKGKSWRYRFFQSELVSKFCFKLYTGSPALNVFAETYTIFADDIA